MSKSKARRSEQDAMDEVDTFLHRMRSNISGLRKSTSEADMRVKVHAVVGVFNLVPQLLGVTADNFRQAANHADRIRQIVEAAGAAATEEAQVQYPMGDENFRWESDEAPASEDIVEDIVPGPSDLDIDLTPEPAQ